MADEPGKLDISDEMIAERRGGSGKMPDDMPKWMAKSIISIDKFSDDIAGELNGPLIKSPNKAPTIIPSLSPAK